MPGETWTPTLVGQAKKALITGIITGKVRDSFTLLWEELVALGPYRANWPNYTKMSDVDYHCHIKKGRPTYVVCWKITNKKERKLEVYYAGTHEKAPY